MGELLNSGLLSIASLVMSLVVLVHDSEKRLLKVQLAPV